MRLLGGAAEIAERSVWARVAGGAPNVVVPAWLVLVRPGSDWARFGLHHIDIGQLRREAGDVGERSAVRIEPGQVGDSRRDDFRGSLLNGSRNSRDIY